MTTRAKRYTYVTTLLCLLVCFALCSGCAQPESSQESQTPETQVNTDPTLVQTQYGLVQGIEDQGVISFKGIPYAAPPLGDLRFAAPEDPEPWEGTLVCREFRDAALQVSSESSSGFIGSEDCLYLNIWKPATASDKKLPVYVYIHGGAYAQGSPAKELYDGSRYASDGIIQVNIAYRLNGLGFLALEELETENACLGNMGTLDQIAALTWVKENIQAFGGDPQNITIGGESAGSFSVSTLIMSPLAEGLFDRAIMESGNLLGQPMDIPYATGDRQLAIDTSHAFMEALGVKTLEELRSLPAEDIVEASYFNLDMTNPSPYVFWPVFDGVVLPQNPYEALVAGEAQQVDILAGFNTDEGTLFIPQDTSEQAYLDYVERVFGDNAQAVMERFPVDESATCTERARSYFKMGLRMGSEVFARELSNQGNQAYYYEFAFSTEELERFDFGAGHALELPFVFDTIPSTIALTEEQEVFKETVQQYWINFIKTGNPNGVDELMSAPEWTPFTAENQSLMFLDIDPRMEPIADAADVDFFMQLFWGS